LRYALALVKKNVESVLTGNPSIAVTLAEEHTEKDEQDAQGDESTDEDAGEEEEDTGSVADKMEVDEDHGITTEENRGGDRGKGERAESGAVAEEEGLDVLLGRDSPPPPCGASSSETQVPSFSPPPSAIADVVAVPAPGLAPVPSGGGGVVAVKAESISPAVVPITNTAAAAAAAAAALHSTGKTVDSDYLSPKAPKEALASPKLKLVFRIPPKVTETAVAGPVPGDAPLKVAAAAAAVPTDSKDAAVVDAKKVMLPKSNGMDSSSTVPLSSSANSASCVPKKTSAATSSTNVSPSSAPVPAAKQPATAEKPTGTVHAIPTATPNASATATANAGIPQRPTPSPILASLRAAVDSLRSPQYEVCGRKVDRAQAVAAAAAAAAAASAAAGTSSKTAQSAAVVEPVGLPDLPACLADSQLLWSLVILRDVSVQALFRKQLAMRLRDLVVASASVGGGARSWSVTAPTAPTAPTAAGCFAGQCRHFHADMDTRRLFQLCQMSMTFSDSIDRLDEHVLRFHVPLLVYHVLQAQAQAQASSAVAAGGDGDGAVDGDSESSTATATASDVRVKDESKDSGSAHPVASLSKKAAGLVEAVFSDPILTLVAMDKRSYTTCFSHRENLLTFLDSLAKHFLIMKLKF
jgi:hypothetical protein